MKNFNCLSRLGLHSAFLANQEIYCSKKIERSKSGIKHLIFNIIIDILYSCDTKYVADIHIMLVIVLELFYTTKKSLTEVVPAISLMQVVGGRQAGYHIS